MSTLQRTLITFAAFIVTFFLVVKVHQDVNGVDSTQHAVVWLVFIAMTMVSLHQWDASYLFGSFVLVYTAMIFAKVGWAKESVMAAGSALTTIFTMGSSRVRELIKGTWLYNLIGWGCENMRSGFSGYKKNRAIRRMYKVSGSRIGGERISEEEVSEFLQVEIDCGKIYGFFDGSDLPLEKVMSGTIGQIMGLQRDHSRLLLRSAHLHELISNEPRNPIEMEIQRISGEADKTSDSVVKAQLMAAIEMKNRRLAELGKLETFLQRVKAQRLQIIDTVQSTFNRLNSLKFSDIQTLEASRDSISGSIREVRSDLDSMERNLTSVEAMARQ